MRTTLTLDPDVAAAIERLREQKGQSLRAVVNKALRAGLKTLEQPRRTSRKFRTKAVSLGANSSNVDDVAELLALSEGDDYR